jgi:hypothetical protein
MLFLVGFGLEKPNHNWQCTQCACRVPVLVDHHGLGCVYDHATAELLALDSHGRRLHRHPDGANIRWFEAYAPSFLAIMLILEMMITVYVHFRINVFAEEALNE